MSHDDDNMMDMPYEDGILMDPFPHFGEDDPLDIPLRELNDMVQEDIHLHPPPAAHPNVAVAPNISPAQGHTPPNNNGNNFDNVLGSDIIKSDPKSMHFIVGASYFDMNPSDPNDCVGDNKQFRAIIVSYFQERLLDRDYVESLTQDNTVVYKVVGEIPGLLHQARNTPLERLGGAQLPNCVRIWKKYEKVSLKESTWKGFHFRDVSQDEKELKNALSSPLKIELKKLFPQQNADQPTEPPDVPIVHPSAPVDPPVQAQRSVQGAGRQAPNRAVVNRAPERHSESRELNMDHDSLIDRPIVNRLVDPVIRDRPIVNRPVDSVVTERRSVMRELNVDEDSLIEGICQKLNEPGTYTVSLHTVYDEREVSPANQYLAKQIESKWCSEKGARPRYVYIFDAGDSGLIVESYQAQARKLRNELGNIMEEVRPSKRLRLAPHTAAKEFLNVFRSTFPRHCECLLIFYNVTHHVTFKDRFLPGTWLEDNLCQETIRGVLLCTPDTQYTGDMGPPFGSNVAQISIDWKPTDDSAGQIYWWDRLPQSNLPFCFENVNEPPELEEILRRNGQAVALVEDLLVGNPAESGKVAVQSTRKWESQASGAGRFAIWLDAVDEERLRTEYQSAIRKVTFSSANEPQGNLLDLSTQSIADSLMSVLMKKSELSLRPHQFTLVFANAPDDTFHENFFSAQSNWFNSPGRFLVTTSGIFQILVEVPTDNTARDLVAVPSFVCPVGPDTNMGNVQDGVLKMAV
mmetsp:Transcript_11200/g.21339  ORF Transcript_11200/g.21339 Transcript_11200/m.21339 type:complete len:745 (+) Transcript_11200:225-2459(+)